MSTRTIRFKFLNLDGVYSMDTAARTYGELQIEIAQNANLYSKFGKKFSDIQLIDRDTKTIYSLPDAVLPATDCIMFVSVVKSKGGAVTFTIPTDYDELDILDEMSYNELRSLGSYLNHEEDAELRLSGTKEELHERIYDYFHDKFDRETNEDCNCCSPRQRLLCIAEELTDIAENLIETTTVTEEEEDGVVLKVTEEDLGVEATAINYHLTR